MSIMSKRQRLEATFAGQPVDRPPVALWRHWPGDDQRADDLARDTLDFQRRYDFDFIKFTPSSNYCIADWGAQSRWAGNQEGTREWGSRVIQAADDWSELTVLDGRTGILGEICRALDIVGGEVGEEVPFGSYRGAGYERNIMAPLGEKPARNNRIFLGTAQHKPCYYMNDLHSA